MNLAKTLTYPATNGNGKLQELPADVTARAVGGEATKLWNWNSGKF